MGAAVFDIAGVRVALTFDMHRDISLLPPGCDVLVYFQANAFDIVDEETAAVAAVADGHFAEDVARSGVWLAYMAPVGAYDEAVYTGGSFVMDEGGRVVAAAPCFEEALLVQEVRRGEQLPCVERRELPQYQRELWLWEGLCLRCAIPLGRVGAIGRRFVSPAICPPRLRRRFAWMPWVLGM